MSRTDTYRFLVPLLGFGRKQLEDLGLINAYIDEDPTERSMILKFTKMDISNFKDINPDNIIVEEDYIYAYFDVRKFGLKRTFDKFLDGKYSLFSADEKDLIMDFWGTPPSSRMSAILYPKEYLMEVCPRGAQLYKRGEIWPVPNPSREFLNRNL